MSRRGRAQHRVDGTAKALIAATKQFNAQYTAADGTFDGVLWVPASGRIELVDWKSPGATLTDAQARLVASGRPLRFVSNLDQLQALLCR
jgi:hypothetical protein